MKRILSFLLAFAMVLGLMAEPVRASEIEEEETPAAADTVEETDDAGQENDTQSGSDHQDDLDNPHDSNDLNDLIEAPLAPADDVSDAIGAPNNDPAVDSEPAALPQWFQDFIADFAYDDAEIQSYLEEIGLTLEQLTQLESAEDLIAYLAAKQTAPNSIAYTPTWTHENSVDIKLDLFSQPTLIYHYHGSIADTDGENLAYTGDHFSVKKIRSENVAQPEEQPGKPLYVDLDALTFKFGTITGSDGTFTVDSVQSKTLTNRYLSACIGSGSYPTGTVAHQLQFVKQSSGCFSIRDLNNGQYFHFGKIGENGGYPMYAFFFDRSSLKDTSPQKQDFFWLYKKDADSTGTNGGVAGYTLLEDLTSIHTTDEILIGALYDVSADSTPKKELFFIRPHDQLSWWVQHAAKYLGPSTELEFKANTKTDSAVPYYVTDTASASAQTTTFHVTVTEGFNSVATLPKYTDDYYLLQNGSNTECFYEYGKVNSISLPEDSGLTPVGVFSYTNPEPLVTYFAQQTQDMHPASKCLYTFKLKEGNTYEIVSAEDPNDASVGLGACVDGDTNNVFTVAPVTDKDAFTLTPNKTDSKAIYLNGWENFNGDSKAGVNNVTEMYLYTPVKGSEPESQALPGYRRVTADDDLNGKSCLIIAPMNGNLYMVRPYRWSGNNNRNYQVAIALKKHLTAQTTFKLKHEGEITDSTEVVPITLNLVEQGSSTTTPVVCNVHLLHTAFMSHTGEGHDQCLKRLTISNGLTYQIRLAEKDNEQSIHWSVAFASDEHYGISNAYDLIKIVKDSANPALATLQIKTQPSIEKQVFIPCIVTATVGDKAYPLEVNVLHARYHNEERLVDLYFQSIAHTTVYYSFADTEVFDYGNSNFRKATEYDALYITRTNAKPLAINFFAKPEDEYALTYMYAGKSSADYMKLDSTDPRQTQFFTQPGAARNELQSYPEETIVNMIQYAIDLGCVGAMGFSRVVGNTGGFSSSLAFRSSKLPTVKKTAAYVMDKDTLKEFAKTVQGKFLESEVNAVLDTNKAKFAANEYNPAALPTASDNTYAVFRVEVTNPKTLTHHAGIGYNDGEISYSTLKVTDLYDTKENTPKTAQDNSFFLLYANYENGELSIATPDGNTKQNELDLAYRINNVHGTSTIEAGTYVYYVATPLTNGMTELHNTVQLHNQYKTTFYSNDYNNDASSTASVYLSTLPKPLKYISLNMGGSLGVNAYIEDDYKTYNDHWVVAEIEGVGNPVTIPFTQGTRSSVTPNGEGDAVPLRRFTIPIAPHQMTANITIYIAENSADGHQITQKKVFTVRQYVDAVNTQIRNGSLITSWTVHGKRSFGEAAIDNTKLQTMLNAMLNYGAAAQKYKNPGVANTQLANDGLAPSALTAPAENALDTDMLWRPSYSPSIKLTFTGLAMELGDDTALRVYFDPKGGEPVSGFVLSLLLNSNGTAYIETDKATIYYEQDEEHTDADPKYRYYIRIPNITANCLSGGYQVQLKPYGGGTATLDISPLAYIYLVNHTSTTGVTNDLKNMVNALYQYAVSAEDYFDTNIVSLPTTPNGGA